MNWTREQEIVILDLYCRIPFQKANNSNKEINDMAKIIGRTANSIKMKIGNFGSFDPELNRLGIVGLSGTSRLDKEVWNTYYGHWDELAYEAKKILANITGKNIEELAELNISNFPKGEEREQMIRSRINQTFFRNTVLSSYSSRCCITGISEPCLIEAAHIVSWAEDESNRTNPSNGLCMNVLMHRAYDRLLLSVTPDYEIRISQKLILEEGENQCCINFFRKVHGTKIITPIRFLPDKDLLAQQYDRFLNN